MTGRGLLAAQVALGRGLSEKEVRQLARGRVWTGKDALQQGLVDALGGLQHAIDLAKQEAGLPLQVRLHDYYTIGLALHHARLRMLARCSEGRWCMLIRRMQWSSRRWAGHFQSLCSW